MSALGEDGAPDGVRHEEDAALDEVAVAVDGHQDADVLRVLLVIAQRLGRLLDGQARLEARAEQIEAMLPGDLHDIAPHVRRATEVLGSIDRSTAGGS